MRRTWARWQGLSFQEKKWLLSMLIQLPIISAALRIFGFNRSHAWLLGHSRKVDFILADAAALQTSERLAELANIAGRRGAVTATCLRQAMLLQWWLRRRGLDAKLKLGARMDDGQFDAHAWVELEDQALGQGALNHRAFDLKSR
ncbi:MAG: lasso peptide biosynthesis B2 protein [Arenimonas sp.]